MGHTKHNPIVRALFNDDDVVLDAVKDLRSSGYHVSEVYSPFPIHGLDEALGLERTRLSTAAFFYGLAGLFFCFMVDILYNDCRLASEHWRKAECILVFKHACVCSGNV